jgi:hypothetical protein
MKSLSTNQRLRLWGILSFLAIILVFSISFYKKTYYVVSWETASLIWTFLNGLAYYFFTPDSDNTKDSLFIVRLSPVIFLVTGWLIFLRITNSSPQGLLKYALIFFPLVSIVLFAGLDFLFASKYGHKDQLRKYISRQLLILVDIPFAFTIALFTAYYLWMNMIICSKIHPSWQEKELDAFFNGATSLQLISANILFIAIDCGMISFFTKDYVEYDLKRKTNLGDNYSKFTKFCDFQPNRTLRIADAIISQMIIEKDLTFISILDIGSSDGELIKQVVEKISEKYTDLKIELFALEPDSIPFQKLNNITFKNSQVEFRPLQLSFDDFINSSILTNRQYSFVLGTHILYHFNFDDWNTIIRSIVNLLSLNGKAILTIDSDDSPIYEKKGSIDDAIKNKNIFGFDKEKSTKTNNYGGYHFANELEVILKEFNYTSLSLDSRLEITRNTNRTDSNLVNAISFLHRISVISKEAQTRIENLFEYSLSENKYVIPWKEVIFRIEKANSNHK